MQKLNNHTVRLLSGTQVITSVHSVVKELVENSLDSGATNVEVNLENYGLDKLEVRDNGCGISKDEAPFIAKCHHTSKLADISELDTLQTFGFRGEALSSLATVANLSIATATQQDEVGMVYTFDTAGNVASKRPIAASVGTCVTVADMFVNLPVRRQFYKNVKQCRVDLRRIEHLMIAFGLSHNNVRFVLRHSKSIIWQKAAMSNLHSNMIAVFGASLVQQMKCLQNKRDHQHDKDSDKHDDSIGDKCRELCGYFPVCGANSSEITRSSSERMFVFVNKRSVEIKQVDQLIRDLFKLAYPNQARRYPVMCLFIKVPQNEVDANLEPGKHAVLLHHLDEILDQLANLLGQLYRAEDPEEPQQELLPEYENSTVPANNDLSQFSDNAVLSPPTTDDVQLSGTAVFTSDDLHSIPIASRDPTSPDMECDSMELQDEPVLGEETEDTVLLTPEDSTTTCNKESTIREQGSDVLHWSRGQCKNRQEMEPVRMLHRDTTSKPCHTVKSVKKPAASLKLTREGSRSMKNSSHKMKLSNFFAKISTAQPSKPPEVTVNFSMDKTKQYWEEGSNLATPASDKLRVIGPIHYRHQWLVLVHKDISLFNVKQANQEALYNRLLASFKLPVTPLPTAISINEHSVGGLDNMALLSALQSESTAANGNRFYCDARLLANGFGVSERIVDGNQCIELVSLHKSVGINDLLETLALIKEQTLDKELCDVTLRECRPLSVQRILQEESIRMSNIQLSTLQAADVLGLIQYANSQCFHLVHEIDA